MKLRIAYKSKIFFTDLESGLDSFVDGQRPDQTLAKVFLEIRDFIMDTAQREDLLPERLTMEMTISIRDESGNDVSEKTPRTLFNMGPESLKGPSRQRKEGGANNGK